VSAAGLRQRLAFARSMREMVIKAHAELIAQLPPGKVPADLAHRSDQLLADSEDYERQIAQLERQIQAVEEGVS
jgi:DNA-binding transcriptional MerR regulator